MQTLGNGVQTAAKWGAAIAAAGAVAATAILGVANSTAEYADKFDKASLRSGIEVENLQRIDYAAGQCGVSLEDIEKSAKKVNDRLGEVSEGNKKSSEMFEKLGVSVRNSDGTLRDSNDVYNDTLMKLAEMRRYSRGNSDRNRFIWKIFCRYETSFSTRCWRHTRFKR